jgi:hypothetical protein
MSQIHGPLVLELFGRLIRNPGKTTYNVIPENTGKQTLAKQIFLKIYVTGKYLLFPTGCFSLLGLSNVAPMCPLDNLGFCSP